METGHPDQNASTYCVCIITPRPHYNPMPPILYPIEHRRCGGGDRRLGRVVAPLVLAIAAAAPRRLITTLTPMASGTPPLGRVPLTVGVGVGTSRRGAAAAMARTRGATTAPSADRRRRTDDAQRGMGWGQGVYNVEALIGVSPYFSRSPEVLECTVSVIAITYQHRNIVSTRRRCDHCHAKR